MKIKLSKEGNQIHVSSPYNTQFISFAKTRGGKFNPSDKSWTFDSRDESAIRAACIEIYGTDGETQNDLCTLKITWKRTESEYCDALAVDGRTLARAWGRDSGAKLGEGIVILQGGFKSGGSVKNWKTETKEDTVVLVRDFPVKKAQELIEDGDNYRTYEIVNEMPAVDRRVALETEKENLLKRLAEIEAELGKIAA